MTDSEGNTGWFCEKWFSPSPHEFVDETTKENRVKYAGDIIPQWRQGVLSKEFVDRYPKRIKGQIKEGILTKEQVKKAKKVWSADVKGLD